MKRHKICGPINKITKLKVCFMIEDENGDWVKWEDVKSLWEAMLKLDPSSFANLIQEMSGNKIKCEGRYEAI